MALSLARQQKRLNAAFPLVLFTDDRFGVGADWEGAARKADLVVVRARDPARRAALAQRLSGIAPLLIADDAGLAARIGAQGLHLPEAKAAQALSWRMRRPDWIITAAAHSLRALMGLRAVDAAFLSPVFASQSHPGAPFLTPVRAAFIAARAPCPVYALGGVNVRNAARLPPSFSGIASVGGLLQ